MREPFSLRASMVGKLKGLRSKLGLADQLNIDMLVFRIVMNLGTPRCKHLAYSVTLLLDWYVTMPVIGAFTQYKCINHAGQRIVG